MKRKVLLLSIIALFTATMVNAQKTVVKANLLSPLVRTGSFFVEHQLNNNSSLQLGLLYTGKTWDNTKIRGWGVTPEYRFYLSDSPAPEGFFVAPYLRYTDFTLENDEDNDSKEANMTGIGGGLLIGQQYIFKERVSFEWFLGPAYTSADLDVKSGAEDDFETGSWDGFTLRAGITLGIAF